jgi:uncharacterized protein YfiM (DUF2279 family)
MTERELHRQKLQAQLDEWKAEIALLKARASGAGAGAQIEMRKHVEALDHRMQKAGTKLSELAAASDDAWDSVKKGVDSAWDSMKAALGEARSKFKS